MDRSERGSGQRQGCLGDGAGNSKIGDLDLALARHEHVAGLDVPMYEPARVRGGDGPRDLGGQACGLFRGQRTAPPDDGRQVLAVYELHDDERAGGIGAVVVDRHDARVIERRGGLRFLAKAGKKVGIPSVFGAQDLDRDITLQLGVARTVDRRHAALAEQFDQSVSTTEDGADLSQGILRLTMRGAPCARIVAYDAGMSGRVTTRQPWSSRPRRWARSSAARSGRSSARSTVALSQPIVVPAS